MFKERRGKERAFRKYTHDGTQTMALGTGSLAVTDPSLKTRSILHDLSGPTYAVESFWMHPRDLSGFTPCNPEDASQVSEDPYTAGPSRGIP